ncbi:MAG: hypothetical protein ACOYN0_07350 [Phycisphaerales bacterium]
MIKIAIGLAGLCVVAATAAAQTPCPSVDNCLSNPSFEETNPFNNVEPKGWHNLSNPTEAFRRRVGDGLLPAFAAVGTPNAITPRTGEWVAAVGTDGDIGFRGFTTDTRNFFAAGFPFFDPVFNYEGPGDVVVSGYYMIPADAPVTGDSVGIKLSVKFGNQDYAVLDPWGERVESLFSGTTNGQWTYFEQRWSLADIQSEVLFNVNEGYFPLIPYANHLKIVLGRFAPNTGATGTVYFDDVSFRQVEPGPTCAWANDGCFADYNNDGGIDGDDVIAFFADWDAGNACADADASQGVDGDDVIAFFGAWDAGGIGTSGC